MSSRQASLQEHQNDVRFAESHVLAFSTNMFNYPQLGWKRASNPRRPLDCAW